VTTAPSQKSPGSGELEADEEVVGGAGAEALAVGALEDIEEVAGPLFGAGDVVVDDADLEGVGAAVFADGEGLAAPDELGAGAAEVLPAAEGVGGGEAALRAVPPFHGVDAPAVADAEVVDGERLGEG
jgi:hypothetical protein